MNRKLKRQALGKNKKQLRNKQNLSPETTGLSLYQLQVLQRMVSDAKNSLATAEDARTEALCRKCLELYPHYSTPYALLGDLATKLGRVDLAIYNYKKSLEILPDVPARWVKLAEALQMQQKFSEAQRAFEKAIKLEPSEYNAILGYSVLKANLGKSSEALRGLEGLIDKHPTRGAAYYFLSQYGLPKELDKYDSVFRALAANVESIEDVADLTNAYYALGKYYDTRKNYIQSMECFIKANQSLRENFSGLADLEKLSNFPQIKEMYPVGGEWSRESIIGSDTAAPIFIVGMPRSGTTLIEQILSSLPNVYGAGELNCVWESYLRIVSEFSSGKQLVETDATSFPEVATAIRREAQIVEQQMKSYSPKSTYIIDKMPQNFKSIGYIRLLFPNAKIIHCKRNPIDTCLSNFKTSFATRLNFTTSLEALGAYYVEYKHLMDHWHTALPGYILDVQYEEVVGNLEEQARRILDFCEMDWDPICLEFYKNKRAVVTASSNQVRQPIYSSSVGQQERYGSLIDPLIKALAPVL